MFRYPFQVMGGYGEILIDEESLQAAEGAVRGALKEIDRIEEKYSFYQTNSFLSVINREALSRPVSLDAETRDIFAFADSLNRVTGGKFDPTVGSLRHCWNFRTGRLPDEKKLATALRAVGWSHVEVKDGFIRILHPGTQIDLGGIVKEYAADRACAVLEARGVRSGLVCLGGDIKVVGETSEGKRPWRVGVAHPRKHNEFVGTLVVTKGAIVTSGDYQRYFVREGVRYHHILDPETGYPVKLQYSGVTVHSQDAMDASSLATSILLGKADCLQKDMKHGFLLCDMEGRPIFWQGDDTCEVRIQ